MREVRERAVLAATILVLSVVDAVFSLAFAGGFSEVNPLLRPLLHVPVAFVIAKTILVTVGVWLLAARDRSSASAGLLVTGVVAYGALDTYWVSQALLGVTRSGW